VNLTEHRHFADELYLSLQRCESAYNVPILQWDATTATQLTGIDDASVHEQWNDTLVGADAIRLGSRLAAVHALALRSMLLPVTLPRVTLHALTGLLGLTLGQVTTVQQLVPLVPSYRHRLTLAPPTQLPSISAQIGHLQNVYALYGGIKGDSFTLQNNSAYLRLTTQLIGAGSRVESTGTFPRALTLLTTGTPPEAHRIADAAAGVWYVSPDGTGSLLIDTVPPAGVSLNVGTGLTLRSIPGPRYRLGVGTEGSLELPVVSTAPAGLLEVAALRDATGTTWYLWMDGDTLTLDVTLPPPALVPREEPALRWGTGRIWLADVTDTPAPIPLFLTQGAPNIGPAPLEVSSRVVGLTLTGENHLLATDAYRLASGAVRSNFHAAHQALTVTLQLEVDPAREAADLAAYLDQRLLALEWQCLQEAVTIVLVTAGTPPLWHQVTDSGGGTWYLGVDVLGELTVSDTSPGGSGLVVGTGLQLLALDGWRYRLGVDGLGQYLLTQTTLVGPTPPRTEMGALRDPSGGTWYVWPDGFGGVEVSATPVLPYWHHGFAWLFPRLQWRALVRSTQAQMDILELTGTVEETPPEEPVVLDVWNAQPGYVQLA
jgi:hypothetical protein